MHAGKIIAVPRHLEKINILDYSPFPKKFASWWRQTSDLWIEQACLGSLWSWWGVDQLGSHCICEVPSVSDSNHSCATLTWWCVYRYLVKTGWVPVGYLSIGEGQNALLYVLFSKLFCSAWIGWYATMISHGSRSRMSSWCLFEMRMVEWGRLVDVTNESKNQPGTKIVSLVLMMMMINREKIANACHKLVQVGCWCFLWCWVTSTVFLGQRQKPNGSSIWDTNYVKTFGLEAWSLNKPDFVFLRSTQTSKTSSFVANACWRRYRNN